MNDSWHIPRASLGGSTAGSSSSSNKSHSNPPTVTRHSAAVVTHLRQEGHGNLALIHNSNEKTSRKALQNKDRSKDDLTTATTTTTTTMVMKKGRNVVGNGLNGLKRGSRSSQGSTDSNTSSHSASSGSMLLTAANLERFVAIHNNKQNGRFLDNIDARIGGNIIRNGGQNYINSLVISTHPDETDDNIERQQLQQQQLQHHHHQQQQQHQHKADTAIIEIDPNLHFVKTKDIDTVSIASSTHFTMVNGMGGPQRKVKEGICSRGHQITVLIVTMSMFFLIGIMAMVYLLEMRYREMPM